MNNDIYGGKDPKNIMRGRQNRAQGDLFEQIIISSCDYYKERGLAFIEKTPEPFHITKSCGSGTFYGNFAKRAQPDFKGTLKSGRSIVFEAKHTDADRITQNRVTTEQSAALDQHAKFNARCYVMVSFGLQRIYLVPWDIWRNMQLTFGRKYLTEPDIARYKLKFDGSLISLLRESTEGGE